MITLCRRLPSYSAIEPYSCVLGRNLLEARLRSGLTPAPPSTHISIRCSLSGATLRPHQGDTLRGATPPVFPRVGKPGFEPRQLAPKASVLPLNTISHCCEWWGSDPQLRLRRCVQLHHTSKCHRWESNPLLRDFTPALNPHQLQWHISSPTRTRTWNINVNSVALCQLSYRRMVLLFLHSLLPFVKGR